MLFAYLVPSFHLCNEPKTNPFLPEDHAQGELWRNSPMLRVGLQQMAPGPQPHLALQFKYKHGEPTL